MPRVIALRPDVVLIVGDVFHSVRTMNAAIIEAFVQLQTLRLALPETEVVIVAGNHERPRATETGSILELFRRIDDYVFFFSSRRRHTRLTCDWSSDVCSSDLCPGGSPPGPGSPARA